MAVVNFTVTKPLAERVAKTIQRDGFTSKAEFFRFVVWHYLEEREKKDEEYARFTAAADRLAATVRKKFRGKKLPSLREQLADFDR